MYQRKVIIPPNQIIPPNGKMPFRNNNLPPQPFLNDPLLEGDDRFLWAPFVFGGLAGTALGYGIANNNQLNNGSYQQPNYGPIPFYPAYPIYPTYSSTNYYY